MVQITPAILSTSEEDYSRDHSRYEQSELLKGGWVHIDFMDNIFVPNKSIGPLMTTKYHTDLRKEAHLMVQHPMKWFADLIEAGFERIIFHIEAADDIEECLEYIKSRGLQVGLAINHETPIESLSTFVFKIDMVLVMSIEPGFQGQPFIIGCLDKIRQIKSKNWPVKLAVDGAVNDQNARVIVEAGADDLIVGSFLLTGDIDDNLEKIWAALR